jgi:hypothetical protein
MRRTGPLNGARENVIGTYGGMVTETHVRNPPRKKRRIFMLWPAAISQ